MTDFIAAPSQIAMSLGFHTIFPAIQYGDAGDDDDRRSGNGCEPQILIISDVSEKEARFCVRWNSGSHCTYPVQLTF